MQEIDKIKKISIWIFLIPFIAINLSLFIVTNSFEDSAIFHKWVPLVGWVNSDVFHYIDGNISISRAVRYFPTKFIFKPAMIITALLLIVYWNKNKNLIHKLTNENKNIKKMYFFGISSAICLIIHAIFLGIGLSGVNALKLEGENLDGISDAVDFIQDLRQIDDLSKLPVGRKVVVIGGGMTAIDIAVQTKKLGSEDGTIA